MQMSFHLYLWIAFLHSRLFHLFLSLHHVVVELQRRLELDPSKQHFGQILWRNSSATTIRFLPFHVKQQLQRFGNRADSLLFGRMSKSDNTVVVPWTCNLVLKVGDA